MIVERIRKEIHAGTVIPKPKAKADFVIKSWGKRRGETALIYRIPNHSFPQKPYEKGVTVSEFEKVYAELCRSGRFTRAWFKESLPACAKEGECNFTTIGGILELIGEARYSRRGLYEKLGYEHSSNKN